jgi:hypothetical protein
LEPRNWKSICLRNRTMKDTTMKIQFPEGRGTFLLFRRVKKRIEERERRAQMAFHENRVRESESKSQRGKRAREKESEKRKREKREREKETESERREERRERERASESKSQ